MAYGIEQKKEDCNLCLSNRTSNVTNAIENFALDANVPSHIHNFSYRNGISIR